MPKPKVKSPESAHIWIPDEIGQLAIKFNDLLGELFLKWTPHQFQIDLISNLIVDRRDVVVCETGRQLGKTEGLIACVGLWGQLVAGSQSYYLAPELKQARKIIWDSGRIQAMLPGNWIDDFKEKNNTVYWANSQHCFFTIDGADKFNANRGVSVKDGVAVFDECRDMKEEVYEVIEPALGVYKCPAVFTSSPPEDLHPYEDDPKRLHWFCELADEAERNPKQACLRAKTSDNPHFDPEKIEETRIRWYARGKGAAFEREYNGKRVEGGSAKEWPMLADDREFVRPHLEILLEISKDLSKLKWYCITDPAGGTVWAWLLIAVNPLSRKIYFLDEIYETDTGKMATSLVWPRALAKMNELYPEQSAWRKYYDEAEAWFRNDMKVNYNVIFHGSKKATKQKKDGFLLYSDIFLAKKAVFSDRCLHTYWEFKNYEDDDSPDHEVDNARYFLNVSNYSLPEKEETKKALSPAEERYRRITGQLAKQATAKNWQHTALKPILH